MKQSFIPFLLISSLSVIVFAEETVVEASAEPAVMQIDAVETKADEPQTAEALMAERSFGVSKDNDVEGVFIGLRMAVLDSYDVIVNDDPSDPLNEPLSVDDSFTGSSTGFRLGYLMGKWRTYIEYSPASELTVDDAAIEVSSYTLATDYAVWRSDAKQHRFSLGAYASDLTVEHTVDTAGGGFSGPEADGLAYGVSTAYRYDVLSWMFIGADLRYGLNGVSGKDNENVNYLGMKTEGSMQFNLELGVHF